MKTKKLLAALLSVLIVLMMLPSAAFAEGTVIPPTTLIVGNVTVVENGSVTANVSGTGWSYDHDTVTLTLNGATINGVDSTPKGAGIYSNGSTLTIVSVGENNSVTAASSSNSAAIYADGSGDLVFSGSGTLTAKGGAATGEYGSSYGVDASGSVTVSGGTLTAEGDKGQFSYGVYATDGVTISDGTLEAIGGEATKGSYGVSTDDYVTVSGTGTLTAEGGEATNSSSYGVSASNVTVSGGTLTATGSEAEYSYGVSAGYSVTVSGTGTLTATGGEANRSYGVRAGGYSVTVSDNGTLTAEGGKGQFSYGVYAGNSVTVSDNGTLTATGGKAGNYSYGVSTDGYVTVSGTGMLTANSGEATKESYGVRTYFDVTVSSGTLIGDTVNNQPTGEGNWLIYGQTGSVQGNVVLTQDITIPEGVEITIPAGATLTIPTDVTLTNDGTIINNGTLTGNVTGNPAESVPQITTTDLNSGTVGTAYSQKLEATGNNITWSLDSGALPDGLTLNSDGTITGTPTADGTSTFTVKAENSAGSDTEQFTLTVNKATVAVTGVTLNKTTLSLVEGASETLTATVEPNTATNKGVIWSSSDETIATVDQTGKVTAVKEGSANITVTTNDGSKTASCAVTVNKPAPAEFVITFDPNGGYVSYTSAVTSGHKLAALPFASKYGYTFTGWYTANGYPVSTDMIFTGNTTLYAGWVYNGIDIPEQPVKPVQPQEPEYEWISEDGGTRLYYDGEMITGWYQDEETGVWYWLDKPSGFMAADQWVKIDGNWYLFDNDGRMLTGWAAVDGKWYYLKPWGGMATGWQYIDNVWYYLRSDGSMAGNAWVMTSGQWYYLTGSGEMATNKWVEWKGDWYFLYSSGVMATNTTIDGYTINSAGIWVQ